MLFFNHPGDNMIKSIRVRIHHFLMGTLFCTLMISVNAQKATEKKQVKKQEETEVVKKEFYTWKDEYGVTHFSDKPQKGAQKVEIVEPTVIESFRPKVKETEEYESIKQPFPQGKEAGNPDFAPAPKLAKFSISQPAHDTQIVANDGKVEVSIVAEPKSEAFQYRLLMDQKIVAPLQKGTKFVLNNVERGTHTLQAEAIDTKGNLKHRTKSIKVHVFRAFARRSN